MKYTIVVFENSEKDLAYIKEAFKAGRVKVMANFPENAFDTIDDYITEQLEKEYELSSPTQN